MKTSTPPVMAPLFPEMFQQAFLSLMILEHHWPPRLPTLSSLPAAGRSMPDTVALMRRLLFAMGQSLRSLPQAEGLTAFRQAEEALVTLEGVLRAVIGGSGAGACPRETRRH